MKKLTLRQFLDYRLLVVLFLFSLSYRLSEEVETWYFSNEPITYDLELILFVVNHFITLLLIISTVFYIIRWFNSFLSWSSKNVFYRVILEIILLITVINFWIYLSSQIYIYILAQHIFTSRDIIKLCASGIKLSFIVIPLVELSIMFHSKYHTDISTKQLQIKNEQFKYELLKNQINPHFLFNSLSILNSLISSDPTQAKKFTNNFSNVLRHVLDFKNTDAISLKEEKEFLVQYIYLLKTRFGDALHVELSFPETYLNKNILPMVLQLLIENVIKHNKVMKSNPMKVNLIANDKGIIVSNRIQIKSSISSWGIGLENIKSRYASLGHIIEITETQQTYSIFIPYI